MFVPIEAGFDRAVRAIADPAVDPELAGLALSPGAEEHSLDEAGDADVAANIHDNDANARA